MSKRPISYLAGSVLLGTAIGAVVGMLTTPVSGREMRDKLRDRASTLGETAEGLGELPKRGREALRDLPLRGRSVLRDLPGRLRDVADDVREAADDVRGTPGVLNKGREALRKMRDRKRAPIRRSDDDAIDVEATVVPNGDPTDQSGA